MGRTGVGGLKIRGGRFWEGGFRLLFRFLDFFERSSGGSYSPSSEPERREGERGEEGGEIGEKDLQG